MVLLLAVIAIDVAGVWSWVCWSSPAIDIELGGGQVVIDRSFYGPWKGFNHGYVSPTHAWSLPRLNIRRLPPGWYARIPLWTLASAIGAPTVVLWWVHHRRRGVCIACDYDLRGLASSSSGMVVCPECGKQAIPRR